jgi:biotin operon repressor
MVQTSARLLALLSLLQVRREWTGQELANRLEVTPRTIRRDVDKLRSLGYPVEAAPGVAGGYRLSAGGELPPLLLDDAEAVAVAVGLRTAASGSIAGIEETSVRALAKLEQVLPSRLRRRVSALSDATSAFAIDGPRIDPDVLASLAGACRDGTRLQFPYVARDEKATSSPPPSSTAAIAGTSSPSTSIAMTGARSAWTGSRAGSARRAAGGDAPCPAVTPPHTFSSSSGDGACPRMRCRAASGSGCPPMPQADRSRRATRSSSPMATTPAS